jgi:hypothetical protein
MSVLLKKEVLCKICEHIKHSPVLIPCKCNNSICKEHVTNTPPSTVHRNIRCEMCKKSFPLPIAIKEDSVTQSILNENDHLTYEGKKYRTRLYQLITVEMRDVVKEFQAKIDEFSLKQSEHFRRIKRDIEDELERVMIETSSRTQRYKEKCLGMKKSLSCLI